MSTTGSHVWHAPTNVPDLVCTLGGKRPPYCFGDVIAGIPGVVNAHCYVHATSTRNRRQNWYFNLTRLTCSLVPNFFLVSVSMTLSYP